MNSQRILRHLVQITLMAGTMCLLPSVQAKSVAAISALTPMTAPSLDLMRDVPLWLRPPATRGSVSAAGASARRRRKVMWTRCCAA